MAAIDAYASFFDHRPHLPKIIEPPITQPDRLKLS